MTGAVRIGTAGWSIARRFADSFPESGSGLERYAARFNAAEINSSFYRSHKPQTYAGWAAMAPEHFRFAVKVPKAVTHERRLVDVAGLLDAFFNEVRNLGSKLGPLLVQFPPSLAFDEQVAKTFLEVLRARTQEAVVCEPRHPTWFAPEADRLLGEHNVARVAADPARVPEAARPGGSRKIVYFRLHGSPQMYYSDYGEPFLVGLAERLHSEASAEIWCIFDNTISGAAIGNAMTLQDLLAAKAPAGTAGPRAPI